MYLVIFEVCICYKTFFISYAKKHLYILWYSSGVGNLRPADRMRPGSNSCAARRAPRGRKIIWMHIIKVVGAARDKTHKSFSARDGKKVAHHWYS